MGLMGNGADHRVGQASASPIPRVCSMTGNGPGSPSPRSLLSCDDELAMSHPATVAEVAIAS